MAYTISNLLRALKQYVHHTLSLETLHDEISLNLQGFIESASEEDLELLSEIHSALYEIEDGLLDEEEFRHAIKELVESWPSSSVITVGHPPQQAYRPYSVRTSTSSADLSVVINAA